MDAFSTLSAAAAPDLRAALEAATAALAAHDPDAGLPGHFGAGCVAALRGAWHTERAARAGKRAAPASVVASTGGGAAVAAAGPKTPHQEAKETVALAAALFTAAASSAAAAAAADEAFCTELCERCRGAAEEEHAFLRDTLHFLYSTVPETRPGLRAAAAAELAAYGRGAAPSLAVAPLLAFLAPVVAGFRTPLSAGHLALLRRGILPLHSPDDYAVWDRQTPSLQLFHEPLLYCMMRFIAHDASLVVPCMEAVLASFPETKTANTGKDVLLLHELEQLVALATPAQFDAVKAGLLARLARCAGSDNWRLIEKALAFWRNPAFAALCALPGNAPYVVGKIFGPVMRGGTPHWNPTVNSMTAIVLAHIELKCPDEFAAAAAAWRPAAPAAAVPEVAAAVAPRGPTPAAAAAPGFARPAPRAPRGPASAAAPPKPQTNLGRDMGGWKPGDKAAPPSTITGMAPWAKGGASGGGGALGFARPQAKASTALKRPLPAFDETPSTAPTAAPGGLAGVRAFMKACEPVNPTGAADAKQKWVDAQMAPTPTLFPSLKFHDLIFGHDLGSGAFSTVRYARRVVKDAKGETDASLGRSSWPEYAVKKISIELIREQGYERAVSREIGVLRVMSHPGLARLVSSFRWRDGAYLVLEYAERGDLHTYVVTNGSLDATSARFVVGEVLAALCAVHDTGFVFADLKPENIVLMSNGHAKLTDFGGARPLTDSARELLADSRHAVRDLRDGDWQVPAATAPPAEGKGQAAGFDADVDDGGDDERVEGTTLYSPPEVLRGDRANFAADAWALGCVLYFALRGRPPIAAEAGAGPAADAALSARIVRFEQTSLDLPADSFTAEAAALARALIEPDAAERASVKASATHAFFAGKDVFALHAGPAPPLKLGSAGPAPKDAAFAQRQFSRIWSALPTNYTFASSAYVLADVPETDLEADAGFFRKAGTAPPVGVPPRVGLGRLGGTAMPAMMEE